MAKTVRPLTAADIDIEDVDFKADLIWLDFAFSADYSLFGIEVPEGEFAGLYAVINPFINEVRVEYNLSEEDFRKTHEVPLSGADKETIREAAERWLKREEGVTLTEFCEQLIREEIAWSTTR